MHAQSKKIGLAALATAMATLIVISLLAYQDWKQFHDAIASRNRTHDALALNQLLLAHVRDVETGQRGYLLTGRAEYLDSYNLALTHIPAELDELKRLLAGQRTQEELIRRLEPLIAGKLDEASRTVELRRTQGLPAAQALVDTGEGKAEMDRIRRISEEIDGEENRRLGTDWAELQRGSDRVRTVSVVGAFLLAGLVALGGLTLRSSAKALERQAAQTELARSAAERNSDLLRVTLYSIGDGVITTDRNGAVQMMNSTAERLTGYTEADAKGRGIEEVFQIVNESTRATVENPVRRVLREGQVVGLANHTVLVSKSGVDAPIDDSGAPIKQKDGSVNGVVLVFRDVSERKKSQDTERRMALIVENSDDAIIGKSLEGIVTSWNRAAERLFGYTAEEMVGQSISRLIPPDRIDDMKAILQRIASKEMVEHYETERMTKDGRRLLVSLTVSPIRDAEGRVIGASKIARDITRQRLLEDAFRQTQKLDAVGRMAGGVAHDFNNLLTVILGYAAVLEGKLPEENPLHKTAVEIRRASEQAASLIGQLLAFSRKQITQLRVIDLNELVVGAKELLQRLVGEDVELALIPEAGACQVKADSSQITQVLMNMAVNARDAMPHGGKLIIETKRVVRQREDAGTAGIRPAGNYIMLAVTDTGQGMDADTQRRLFEPFFTTKETGKGAGMGLASSYGIVQQHGGWIDVYSELNHGTAFRIYIPEQAATPVAVTRAAPAVRTGTILLVEDQAAIRMLAEDVLSDAGYRVYTASNGVNGLKVSKEHQGEFDLLVTDVVMPEMSGPELAAQMNQARPGLRVLYISGYTDHALLRRGVIEEGTDLLQKPFLPESLLAKVDEMLARC